MKTVGHLPGPPGIGQIDPLILVQMTLAEHTQICRLHQILAGDTDRNLVNHWAGHETDMTATLDILRQLAQLKLDAERTIAQLTVLERRFDPRPVTIEVEKATLQGIDSLSYVDQTGQQRTLKNPSKIE
jgi:hypothetical protein